MVDYPIDTTLLIANPGNKQTEVAERIFENSKKYAALGQFGIVLNKANETHITKAIEAINSTGIDLLGVIPDFGENINYEENKNSLKTIYSRLNLPQG